MSPPLLLSFQKDREEASLDVFGFMYQQSADLVALHQFGNNLHSHVTALAQNNAIKIGSIIYEEIVQTHKNKQDEKLVLAQR